MSKQNIPWVDKYRPKKLEDIVDQKEVIKILNKTLETKQLPHLLFYGQSGTGKCLAYNTKVMMYNGEIKNVQDIVENDVIMGDDNTPRTVLNTVKGNDILYRIRQDNNDYYDVNSVHIISLKLSKQFIIESFIDQNSYKLIWFKNHIEHHKIFFNIDELNDYRDNLMYNNDINKEGDICDIKIEDYMLKSNIWKDAYRGYRSKIIKSWDKKEVGIDPYLFGYRIGHNILKLDYIPNEYKTNNTDTRYNILAGLIDSIGYFNIQDKIGYYGLHNYDKKVIVDDIIFIARSLGIQVKYKKEIILDNIYYYRLEFRGKNINNIPTRIIKRDVYVDDIDHTYKIEVEKLSVNDYYGFEIDGNKRFLLGDFTVTHNTSSILAVAYQLFGPKIFNDRVIELNASDERGINVVRNKINTFAQTALSNVDPNYPCPPFKLVILDEADAMTTEAQSALRKIMEELSHITRFCFICNYKNQIIEPIVSRCMKFRFKPIGDKIMKKKLKSISKSENMKINNDSIKAITDIVKGDIRKGIMILQKLRYMLKYKNTITSKDVYDISGYIHPEYIQPIWELCLDKNCNVKKIINEVEKINKMAIPITSILETLQYLVINSNIEDDKKSKICLHISFSEKRLIDGANEQIQILSILSYIYGVVNNHISDVKTSIC